jgi:hypothetical protein
VYIENKNEEIKRLDGKEIEDFKWVKKKLNLHPGKQ